MTIERTWVRVFWSTSARLIGTLTGLFVLIVPAPIVLLIIGLPLLAGLVFIVGVGLTAALVLALLPKRGRRY